MPQGRVSIRRFTRWRDPRTGRFVPTHPTTRRGREARARAVPIVTEHLYIDDKFVKQTGYIQETSVVKTSLRGRLEDPPDPRKAGMIRDELARMNVFSQVSRQGAKRVEITVRGTDEHQRHRRFKQTIDVESEKLFDRMLTGQIVKMLHERGYRTQYSIQLVPGKRPGPGMKASRVSKRFVAGLEQLHNTEIIVKIYK